MQVLWREDHFLGPNRVAVLGIGEVTSAMSRWQEGHMSFGTHTRADATRICNADGVRDRKPGAILIPLRHVRAIRDHTIGATSTWQVNLPRIVGGHALISQRDHSTDNAATVQGAPRALLRKQYLAVLRSRDSQRAIACYDEGGVAHTQRCGSDAGIVA